MLCGQRVAGHLKNIKMRKLTVSPEKFTEMLVGLIKSGATFEATELKCGDIEIEFTGGY